MEDIRKKADDILNELRIREFTKKRELYFLLEKIYENVSKGSIIIEIGTACCGTAIPIAVTNPECLVISIDPYNNPHAMYFADYHTNFRRIIKAQIENLILVYQKAEDFAGNFNKNIDYLWIDGNHSYEAVIRDITLWTPKLNVNCIVSGHDYDHVDGGVKKAVDELIKGNPNYKEFDVSNNSIWYARKIK